MDTLTYIQRYIVCAPASKGFSPRNTRRESHRPRSTCDAKCETLISRLNRASDDQSDISGLSAASCSDAAELVRTASEIITDYFSIFGCESAINYTSVYFVQYYRALCIHIWWISRARESLFINHHYFIFVANQPLLIALIIIDSPSAVKVVINWSLLRHSQNYAVTRYVYLLMRQTFVFSVYESAQKCCTAIFLTSSRFYRVFPFFLLFFNNLFKSFYSKCAYVYAISVDELLADNRD